MTTSAFETLNAKKGATMAAVFGNTLGASFDGYRVTMCPPERSTNAGENATQKIVLEWKGGAVATLGWANLADKTAELRTHGVVAMQAKATLGRALDIALVDYVQFADKAAHLLEQLGVEVDNVETASRVSERPPARASERPAARRSSAPSIRPAVSKGIEIAKRPVAFTPQMLGGIFAVVAFVGAICGWVLSS
jgi:hypothetical protein